MARERRKRPAPHILLAAIRAADGSLRGAAKTLKIPHRTFHRWAIELGVSGTDVSATAHDTQRGPQKPVPAEVEIPLPDWSDPESVRAWRLSRWAALAQQNGQAAISAIDKISAATRADDHGVDERGALSHADAQDLRAVRRRWAQWIGQAIQRRIRRHEAAPSTDPIERDRDERLRQAWIPVATLAAGADKDALILVLQEFEDLCSL